MQPQRVKPRRRPRTRKGTTMNGKTILIQCNRPDLGTSYARFSVGVDALKITYGNVCAHGLFSTKRTPAGEPVQETLPYSEHGEAQLVHNGRGWNVSELNCWVKFLESEGKEE